MSLNQFFDKKDLKITEQQNEIYRLENELRIYEEENRHLQETLNWEYKRDHNQKIERLQNKCIEYYKKICKINKIIDDDDEN